MTRWAGTGLISNSIHNSVSQFTIKGQIFFSQSRFTIVDIDAVLGPPRKPAALIVFSDYVVLEGSNAGGKVEGP